MQEKDNHYRRVQKIVYKRFYWLLIAVVVLNVAVALLGAPDQEVIDRYNITAAQLKLISLSVFLPLFGIWFAAFYGFIHFENYATSIVRSPDGKGLKKVADGLLLIGLSLPLNSLVSSALEYGVDHEIVGERLSTIIDNYFALVLPLLGAMLLFKGATQLLATLKKPVKNRGSERIALTLVVLTGAVYAILTLVDKMDTSTSTNPSLHQYVPGWLIVATVIVPYVLMWAWGLVASLRLRAYHRAVEGAIYKPALSRLQQGVLVVILTSIGLQLFTVTMTNLESLSLGPLLIIVYILLAVISAGYILIALGAKRLRKIEEVV